MALFHLITKYDFFFIYNVQLTDKQFIQFILKHLFKFYFFCSLFILKFFSFFMNFLMLINLKKCFNLNVKII